MKKLILLAFISFFAVNAFSQISVGDYFKSGLDNAQILATEYMRPYGEMMGTSLNSGWYTSAKPHKLLGFDITFTTTITMAPASAKTFDAC
jgi:hypothetical protein